MVSLMAGTQQRPTPFGLGTQFTAFATPQTQFNICLSKGHQILPQRLAKGKEVDTSENPTWRWRRLALHQHQLIKIFTKKGFASLGDRAAIQMHRETLSYRSGLSPIAKGPHRRECEDSTFGVGTIWPGQGFAYCENAQKNSTLWRVRSNFSWFWTDDFVVELPFISISFIAYIPPSYDEVRALQLSSTSLLRQNQLLRLQNEELLQHNQTLAKRNAALTDQVMRLTEVVRRRILP